MDLDRRIRLPNILSRAASGAGDSEAAALAVVLAVAVVFAIAMLLGVT